LATSQSDREGRCYVRTLALGILAIQAFPPAFLIIGTRFDSVELQCHPLDRRI